MRERTESRDTIREGIKKRKSTIDDRARHMGLVVKDKQQVVDASRKLRLSTTSEGAEAVKKAIREAAQAADAEFARQNTVIENKFTECKQSESDLRNRTKLARDDASKVRSVAGQVKETKEAQNLMGTAEKAATDDAAFTAERKKHQERIRAQSQGRRDRQKRQLMQMELRW